MIEHPLLTCTLQEKATTFVVPVNVAIERLSLPYIVCSKCFIASLTIVEI